MDFSCNAIHELSISPLTGNYGFEHYCGFHAYIFKDIYEWAGKPRTVEMEKAEAVLGHTSIEYAKPDEISRMATAVLEGMNGRDWKRLSLEEQAEHLSDAMSNLWNIHSFREGNTRTTITFICQFADSKGMPMGRKLFEEHPAYTRNALVAASAVFQDGDFRQPEYLYQIMKDSLERGCQKDRQQGQRMGMDGWRSQIARTGADGHPGKKGRHTETANGMAQREV